MCGQDWEKQKRLSVLGKGKRQGFVVGMIIGLVIGFVIGVVYGNFNPWQF
jgi:hypothetical protein